MKAASSGGGRRRLAALMASAFGLLLAACSNVGPQDALHPEGPTALKEHHLIVPVFVIAGIVFVIVEGLIVFATFRFRDSKRREEPVQVHGNTRMEIGWTIAPALVLAIIAVPTVIAIFQLAERPVGANVVNVEIHGHQWWWEYRYMDFKPAVKTATELVIPVGKKIHLDITSDDVIHSFWVPKLAGKQDAVPGRMNQLTLEATKPGTYYGQCAEFCALSHANMRLRVIAMSPADFTTWLTGQQQAADIPAAGLAAQGAGYFAEGTCAKCHTVRGLTDSKGNPVSGVIGPDLTHFASRFTFAGAIFDRNDENLITWLRDPPAVKPGSIMPNYHLSSDVIRQLVAFLESLK